MPLLVVAMSWRVSLPMDERIRFIQTYRAGGLKFTGRCAFFGVSCKTGYKWVHGWKAEYRPELLGRSHANRTCPIGCARARPKSSKPWGAGTWSGATHSSSWLASLDTAWLASVCPPPSMSSFGPSLSVPSGSSGCRM